LASKKSSQLEASKTSGLSPTITASRVYFSILQAADYTTATPSWIEEQLRNGKLPYRWIGNKRVIFRRDLDELMESLPVETGLCDVPAFLAREVAEGEGGSVRVQGDNPRAEPRPKVYTTALGGTNPNWDCNQASFRIVIRTVLNRDFPEADF
jgi:excisionase family DNA binding protein